LQLLPRFPAFLCRPLAVVTSTNSITIDQHLRPNILSHHLFHSPR
jgi:hypothetical protein